MVYRLGSHALKLLWLNWRHLDTAVKIKKCFAYWKVNEVTNNIQMAWTKIFIDQSARISDNDLEE